MNRHQSLRVIGALAAAPVLLAAPVRAQSLKPLKIALIPGDISAEAYYAKDLGYFAKAGFDVEFLPITNGAAISSAVVSGAADLGFSNVISLATAHDKGLPFTLLAPANLHVPNQVTAGILTVLKSGPIRTAKDLNGKTVAVNGLNNISDVSVRAWVDQNGGDAKTLKFVEFPFPQMPGAVEQGKVDAASIDAANEQLLAKADSPFRRLANVFNAVGTHFCPSVWFTTTSWVEAHPADAKAIVAIMAQAATWANDHHAESAAILGKYLNKSTADIESVTRAPYAVKLTPDLVQPSIDAAVKYGLVKTPFAASTFISPLAR